MRERRGERWNRVKAILVVFVKQWDYPEEPWESRSAIHGVRWTPAYPMIPGWNCVIHRKTSHTCPRNTRRSCPKLMGLSRFVVHLVYNLEIGVFTEVDDSEGIVLFKTPVSGSIK